MGNYSSITTFVSLEDENNFKNVKILFILVNILRANNSLFKMNIQTCYMTRGQVSKVLVKLACFTILLKCFDSVQKYFTTDSYDDKCFIVQRPSEHVENCSFGGVWTLSWTIFNISHKISDIGNGNGMIPLEQFVLDVS